MRSVYAKYNLYQRLLKKMYNTRCNEFIRASKAISEHCLRATQDRQVMLRQQLKVTGITSL